MLRLAKWWRSLDTFDRLSITFAALAFGYLALALLPTLLR